jgi:excisionase family DNA binding protein
MTIRAEDRIAWSHERLLTVAEVARLLQLNHQTIRNWITAGTLPSVKIGRAVRIRLTDYEDLISRGSHPKPARIPDPDPEAVTAEEFWIDGDVPAPVLPTHLAPTS